MSDLLNKNWSTGVPITMAEILDAREHRAWIQQELLSDHTLESNCALISFTLNIPGPIKVFPYTVWAFYEGIHFIESCLTTHQLTLLTKKIMEENTGYEAFFLIKGITPETLKSYMTAFEDGSSFGRIFDLDILRPDSTKVSRTELGLSGRTCLLCDNPVFVCSRSRTHSAKELSKKTLSIIEAHFFEVFSSYIGTQMTQALISEVNTTLKPGLVDRYHNGSHKDMNRELFLKSADSLFPYFCQSARLGLEAGCLGTPLPEVFSSLRVLGLEAEQTMYQATNGVNTHKGAVFSGGILCCTLGYTVSKKTIPSLSFLDDTTDELSEIIKEMLVHLLDDLKLLSKKDSASLTHGEKLYLKYQVTGIRGEAQKGFPSLVQLGLPLYKKLLQAGFSRNDAGCILLLHYIAYTQDSNLITRSDYQTAQTISTQLASFLENSSYEKQLEVLPVIDKEFVKANLSPGGSADLLALTYFLYEIYHTTILF